MRANSSWSVARLVSFFISNLQKGDTFSLQSVLHALGIVFPKKSITYGAVYQELNSLSIDGFLNRKRIGKNIFYIVNMKPYDLNKLNNYDDLKFKNLKSGTVRIKKLYNGFVRVYSILKENEIIHL